MKIILSGYERSLKILPTCLYLLHKYLPKIFTAYPVINTDDVSKWSMGMRAHLLTLDDELVIMGDSDMLINSPFDEALYSKLLKLVKGEVICARLCQSSFYEENQFTMKDGIMTLRENAPYTAVLQYCIWNREFLISLLERTTDPWNFEILGSTILNNLGKKVIGTKEGALSYYEHGAFHHEKDRDKVNLSGVKREDVEYLLVNNYLMEEEIL